MKRKITLAATGLVLLAGCGGGHPAASTFTVHGIFADAGCLLSTGDQLVVLDPSGKVIATTTLPTAVKVPASAQTSITGPPVPRYRFTVTVPPEPRYGIKLNGMAAFWETSVQMRNGPALICQGNSPY